MLDTATSTYSFRALPGTNVTLSVEDRSGDGGINTTSGDAELNRAYILGVAELNDIQKAAADVDNSADINTLDVNQQRKNALNTQPVFRNNFGNASLYSFINLMGKPYVFTTGKTTHSFDFTVIQLGKVAGY